MNIIIKPEIFPVKLGGPETTDEVVASLGFPANKWITQKNFPIAPRSAIEEVEIQIVDPGQSFNEKEGLAIIAEVKLERPTYEHGIQFSHQYGKITTSSEKPFVIFLHKAWFDTDGVRRVLCLFRNPGHRWLHLDYPGDGFFDSCVVAGVKPRQQSLII